MTTEQRAFFELVRAGLWGTTADASAFDDKTDWNGLYNCGRSQTLLGVMLDGIQTLPETLRPERSLYIRWCASVLQTEENNRKLNREAGNLFTLLRAHGVEPVLLKGQGTARNYLRPLHRQCGDIDVYIGNENFERVNRLLEQDGHRPCEVNYKHSTYDWHGVSIENHRILAKMKSPLSNRRLQRYVASWHGTDKALRFDLDGCMVTVPPVEFDASYLLFHSVDHLLNSGVGLRQVCDWTCLLHNNRTVIDREAIARQLRLLRLERAARIFGAIAVEYLGLPEEELPVRLQSGDRKLGEWLMEDIWRNGNFGHSNAGRKPRPKGYWRGKWHTFTTSMDRIRSLWRVAPMEALWTPATMIDNVLQAQKYKYFGLGKSE